MGVEFKFPSKLLIKKRGQSMFPFNTALYMCTELVIPYTVSIKCEEIPGLSPKDLQYLEIKKE